MATKPADILAKAAALEPKLQGKRFLGGDAPSADDVKEFEALLGAGNLGLFRWVKHMASFSAAERAQWGAPVKPVKAPAKKEAAPAAAAKPAAAPKAAAAPAKAAAADDDDFDMFGEETEEDKAAKAANKKANDDAAAAKKKAAPIAKSSILMDIKPFDDTTDLETLVKKIKAIEKDGVLWGAHKLVPVAYGIKKLQLLMVIEDAKVTGDEVEEMITDFEDDVQSMDIVAWNKI